MTRPSRIEDYAMIGDCETVALVSLAGSIDWLCLPRFDSPACFAALLGSAENGHFRIAPADAGATVTRRYRDGTLILETDFETAAGAATLIDFMPPRDGVSNLVRVVVGRRGQVTFDVDLVVRYDYGRTVPWVSRLDETTLTAVAGPDQLVLRTPVTLKGENLHTKGRFTVNEGDRVPFTLTHLPSNCEPGPPIDCEAALRQTEAFWTAFSSRCPAVGPWTADVKRSLVLLKGLTYAPTGGIVAAATTSLPELAGGARNWDYRFCWLRDATMTLMSFMRLGYYDEAAAWREWLLRSVAGDPRQLQIMYGVAGERRLAEWQVDWLDGFLDSKPVRIGNAAAEQLQLDVFGEVMDAMSHAVKGGLKPHPRSSALTAALVGYLESAWREPDEGIWEVRGGRRHFVHSKVMAWVAFDRAADLASAAGSRADAARWRVVADEIHQEVCRRGFDAGRHTFVQSYGSSALDASLLQIPLVGFLRPDDPRVIGTVRAIEEDLLHDGFVRRYDTRMVADGLNSEEGAFLACSFWLVDVWALQGRRHDAVAMFERLRALQNDVGMLAEEYDPVARRLLGNVPQAFSHVGLINSALSLARGETPATRG